MQIVALVSAPPNDGFLGQAVGKFSEQVCPLPPSKEPRERKIRFPPSTEN
jgi:hypothetical protein